MSVQIEIKVSLHNVALSHRRGYVKYKSFTSRPAGGNGIWKSFTQAGVGIFGTIFQVLKFSTSFTQAGVGILTLKDGGVPPHRCTLGGVGGWKILLCRLFQIWKNLPKIVLPRRAGVVG